MDDDLYNICDIYQNDLRPLEMYLHPVKYSVLSRTEQEERKKERKKKDLAKTHVKVGGSAQPAPISK